MVYPTITVPFSAWLLMGFFKSIPPETEEAALCDGYHPYGAFPRVALPLARPGIISVRRAPFHAVRQPLRRRNPQTVTVFGATLRLA